MTVAAIATTAETSDAVGAVSVVYTTTAAGGEELARLRAVVTELAGEVLPTHSDTERSVSTHTRDCRE